MKRRACLTVLILCLLLLPSCEYDRTTQIRQCFLAPTTYSGTLQLDSLSYCVTVSVLEDGDLRLCFTDGVLKGLEKHLSENCESDRYDGMEFALPHPDDFYALYDAFVFLRQQNYTRKSFHEAQSYTFDQELFQIAFTVEGKPEMLQTLSLSYRDHQLTFSIKEIQKEHYD